MLASEPPSSRVHAGGGISVRVNGAAFEASVNSIGSSSEKRNIDNSQFGGDSEILAENRTTGWANATITWRSGAKPFTGGRSADVSNSNADNSSVVTTPQMVTADSSIEDKSSAAQLVHVIRVKSTTPLNRVAADTSVKPSADMARNDNQSNNNNNIPPASIRIKSQTRNLYQVPGLESDYQKNNNEKVSMVVGTSLNDVMKGEDERSSSGASSAPGSDCERSDSDREGDDGTDSGFSSSRRPCASIIVTAKNSINLSDSYHSFNSSDLGSESSHIGTTKVPVTCCSEKSDVKLTIASYADKESNDAISEQLVGEGRCDMHFHLRELDSSPTDKQQNSDDVQTKIAAAHALLSGQDGSYTLKNRVRSSIVSLLVQSASNRNYEQEEVGRVVFYTTSMGVVRNTFERCRKVRKILETLLVKFEERDVFMNRGFQQEIRERLGASRVIVPQVFVEGRHLGSVEVLEQLNEIGHLRIFLRPYKRLSVGGTCQNCGGYRYLLCPICGGSKKSVTHRHHFSEDLVALRCVTCDESGLIRCPQCINGEG